MDFDFSGEQNELREQARRFLSRNCSSNRVRSVLEIPGSYDRELWSGLAELGHTAIVIPEAYGGLGASHLELCVVAEELGRAIAPVPFYSSVYLATEFILAFGTEEQKLKYLPDLASGKRVGCFAGSDATGMVHAGGGRLTGQRTAVVDGMHADFAVLVAQGEAGASLYLLDLDRAEVRRSLQASIDPTRSVVRLDFLGAPGELLGDAGQASELLNAVLDRAVVLTAFEQLGGAERCLEMARDYALERMAFGRPIGSFQAVKHMLADMYVAVTLARSNCYYAAWAMTKGSSELSVAAATARVSATQAYQECARNNIQVHGGMGFTWESDCHLHYRRSNLLAVALGSLSQWQTKLVARMQAARGDSATVGVNA